MRGHALYKITERILAFEKLRQEIQGRQPKGPFEFADDLNFKDVGPEKGDLPVIQRFRKALVRDLRYSSAGAVYLHNFSYSQNLRSIYDGGRQLIDGGAEAK